MWTQQAPCPSGTQDPWRQKDSSFLCHLQASRRADLPRGDEEKMCGPGTPRGDSEGEEEPPLGEGGHRGRKCPLVL